MEAYRGSGLGFGIDQLDVFPVFGIHSDGRHAQLLIAQDLEIPVAEVAADQIVNFNVEMIGDAHQHFDVRLGLAAFIITQRSAGDLQGIGKGLLRQVVLATEVFEILGYHGFFSLTTELHRVLHGVTRRFGYLSDVFIHYQNLDDLITVQRNVPFGHDSAQILVKSKTLPIE